LSIDLDRSRVLLDDNVVTEGETKTCPFAGWLGGKEWIEYFLFYPGRNADAIVAYADLDAVTEASCRSSNGGLVTIPHLRLLFHRRIDTIRN
jgi:hypothetical protein